MTAGTTQPWAVSILVKVVRPIVGALYRPTIEGLDRLPVDEPYLLVSNHNAGLGAAEIFSFASLWAEQFGATRPLAAFAHPLGFKVWPTTALHRGIGSIPSTYEAAHEALGDGVPILVFPGGDYETLRPVWQANRVDFGGRQGFLRIAQTAEVAIVPMGIQGSHYTCPMLYRARWLAWFFILPRLIGQKRWGISLMTVLGWLGIAVLPIGIPLRLLLAFMWASSPFIFLPVVPWPIRFRIGEPISCDELFAHPGPDGALNGAYILVTQTIERLVRG